MSDSKTPAQLLEQLIAAIGKREEKSKSLADFASENNLQQKFVYGLMDGKYPTAQLDGKKVFARQDIRYQKIENEFRLYGISGFLQAVEAAQRAEPRNAPVINFTQLYTPMRQLEQALEASGAFNDPQIAELYSKLQVRILELRRNQTKAS